MFLFIWMLSTNECISEVKEIKGGHWIDTEIKVSEPTPEEEAKYEFLDKFFTYAEENPGPIINEFLKEYEPKDYNFIVTTCKDIISNENEDYQNKFLCARILGRLANKDAVQVLIDNIPFSWFYDDYDYEYEVTLELVMPLEIKKKDFPCAYSLYEIGNPSEEALLEKIATTDDDVIRLICLKTITKIKGKKKVRTIIEKALKKETDSIKKSNLKKALELY